MTDSLNATSEYDDYESQTQTPLIYQSHLMKTRLMFLYLPVYTATLLMGTTLNATIIVIMAFHKNKRVRQWTQIMGLATTHLVFCLITPLYLISAWEEFSWPFGKSLCKLGSYIVFMNMFSNSLIITWWNVRWCVSRPVTHLSACMTLLSCFLGAILAAPSLLSRDIQKTAVSDKCFENYDYTELTEQTYMSPVARKRMSTVVISRFVFGLLLPLGVIGISSCVRSRRHETIMSRVLRPVTFAHFLCWAPVLCLSVLQVKMWEDSNVFTYGLAFATGVCSLNSVICPIICLIQGKKELDQNSTRSEDEPVSLHVVN